MNSDSISDSPSLDTVPRGIDEQKSSLDQVNELEPDPLSMMTVYTFSASPPPPRRPTASKTT